MRDCSADARGAKVARAAVAVLACLTAACTLFSTPRADDGSPIREWTTSATLHGVTLEVHLAEPTTVVRPDLLVVYATGDGGWFGAAIDQWRRIARAGYLTAGFSARAFLRIDRPAHASLDQGRLATEYMDIVGVAQRETGSRTRRVVLTGWSRGAGFSILVAGAPEFRAPLAGVVALGLTEGEDLADTGGSDDGARENGRSWPFDLYERIRPLRVPVAVIQATGDDYLTAAQARQRFGSDGPLRRLYEIEAANHRFSGGTEAFDTAFRDALAWVSSTGPIP